MRRLLVLAIVVAGLALGACAPLKGAGPAACSPLSPTFDREMLDAVNADRAARGLAAVQNDQALTTHADAWAENMAARRLLYHSGTSGENIATAGLCVISSAAAFEDYLMGSDGHRANILFPDVRFLGVGVAVDNSGAVWVVQRFG